MKHLLLTLALFFTLALTAQDYKPQWEKVMQAEAEGLVQTAAAYTDTIYALAKKDNNEPQLLKTFFFRSRYMQTLQEDAQIQIITNLQTEIKTASVGTAAFLESLYAGMLADIYERNEEAINSITPTDSLTGDFTVWPRNIFREQISAAYLRSLQNRDVLYAIPLERYSAIIEFNPMSPQTNRSLYDFLAEKYTEGRLSPSENDRKLESTIKAPYLGTTQEFLKIDTELLSYGSFKDKIAFCKQLEAFYLSKKDYNSLYRATLRRLTLVYDSGFFDSYDRVSASGSFYRYKDNLLHATLQQLIDSWGNNTFAYRAKLELAKLYKSGAYKKEHPDYNIKALALLDDVIVNTRINDAANEALQLKSKITNTIIRLETERFVVPNKPILARVSFKNTDTLSISIYKISSKDAATGKLYSKLMGNKKPFLQKVYTLPHREDYFEYETEIILPGLPKGIYAVIINKADNTNNPTLAILQSTQTTVIEQEQGKTTLYQVADIETGAPLAGASIIMEGKKHTTNKEGRVNIAVQKPKKQKDKNGKTISGYYRNFDVYTVYKGDTLSTMYNHYFYGGSRYDDEDEEIEANIQLYTDRAIYRPGQTVFFKGIVLQYKKGKNSVVPNVYVSVSAYKTSGQKFKSFRLKTNQFGSFTEQFVLPLNTNLGEFSIRADEDDEPEDDPKYNKRKDEHPFWDNIQFNEADLYFRVEEYKRPTFDIAFDDVTEDIRVNQEVTFTGKAKSFSGAPVQGATVTYRITRRSSYTNYRGYGDYDNAEITSGKTTTLPDGSFKINFTTLPNPGYDPAGLPVFTYTIYTNVSDTNGETHNSEGTLDAGYHSLSLTILAEKVINPKNKDSRVITLNSQNLNGQFLATQGNVKIYKIVPVNNLLRSRPWSAPELQTIPRSVFEEAFPYLPYKQSNNDTIVYDRIVADSLVNTATQKTITLQNLENWYSGRYQVVFSAKDSGGNEIITKSEFTLQKDQDPSLPTGELLETQTLNKNLRKDGFAAVQLHSALPLYVNITAYDGQKHFQKTIYVPKGQKQVIKVPHSATSKLNFINIDYVWQNQLFEANIEASDYDAVDKITIESSTITDKLQPGKPQNWTFTIKGSNMPAEVLASMYDASLDKFEKNRWLFYLPHRNVSYNYRPEYRQLQTTNTISLNSDSYVYQNTPFITRYEHQLNTFGFNINKSKNIYLAYNANKADGSKTTGAFMLTGVVSDESGMPIPGVFVQVEGTNIATQTDFDGIYTLGVNKNDVIVFSYIGMHEVTAQVADQNINIVMKEGGIELKSIAVEGYSSLSYALSNSSIIIIENNSDPYSFIQSLQGQVSGLNISTGSGSPGSSSSIVIRGLGTINGDAEPLYVIDGVPLSADAFKKINTADIENVAVLKDAAATSIYGNRGANGVIVIKTKQGTKELETLKQVQTRRNFNETAFFYPQLLTDKQGNINVTFTTPESLTEWKLRLVAHNKNAVSGYFENTFMSQKDLMVVPNMPRFLRESDTITLTSKITNMTAEPKTGNAILQLFDAVTMQPADVQMRNTDNVKPFTIAANGSTTVSWTIAVPTGLQGVQYKVLAKAGDFTDGEENILPVLTNSMLVTESLPLWVKANSTKSYTFNNLKNNTSATLRHQGITLEYTSNPAWVALQSLPYLIEFEHECAEQVFSRYYANAIATHIINSNPKIAQVFAAWRKADKPLSKLEQNEELKSIILAESPWLLDAQSEEEKKNRLALLFDLDKMKQSLDANFDKLAKKQSGLGGFSWFEGGTDNEYITRHILAGFGHLNKLGITPSNQANINVLTKYSIDYLDKLFLEQYKNLEKLRGKRTFTLNYPSSALHYLYTRSFYVKQHQLTDSLTKAIAPYIAYTKTNWLEYSLYEKGLAALALNRFGETATAKKIINSLKQSSALNEEQGMYWIENKSGWYWYRAPIETQALLIEAFAEVTNDTQSVDAMKVWLLKQKQNRNWPTTKSTSEAVYALLLQGTDWLSVKESTTFKLGDQKVFDNKLAESATEAGTGYIKLNWQPNEVTTDMATLTVENKGAVPGYGGFYWQYFEDLDKVKPAQEGIMNISKELYLKKNTADGEQLQRITPGNPLQIGDLVTVRLVLTIKEDVEFVHLKDMRASAFEPVDVLSNYEYRDGLGYYRSTRDAATHFFFDNINKGTYVLEYDVRVNNAGEFSNGITTLQSMYAPEFSAHTKGERVKTVEK
ncbi:alpha-2-macroglobulin family protein [Flavobacterium subsaxonicum]|uniref:alpha-2-macroglobulin family protein n=1 Tax=Flavobacterium subsaxonicum TaxID=426226 RepID=UPI0003FC227F|nr:alpha-2-macroglobulin family protein [Flavobacterium subsaxonicum]